MWANLPLLFWLSLFPFVTGLDGGKPFLRRGDATCFLAAKAGPSLLCVFCLDVAGAERAH